MPARSAASVDRSPADVAMDRYARGDDTAFAEIYAFLAPRLRTYLQRRCGDRQAADDLLQQTFLRLHRSRATFVPGAPVAPWAFTIAASVLADGHRARRREPPTDPEILDELPSAAAGADEALHVRHLSGRLHQAFRGLPTSQQTAYQLVRHEGLSLADAAGRLGVSVVAVKLRLHRAGQALQGALAA
jgi:RNA polymerase sigma-70 factor, ECF subfamily